MFEELPVFRRDDSFLEIVRNDMQGHGDAFLGKEFGQKDLVCRKDSGDCCRLERLETLNLRQVMQQTRYEPDCGTGNHGCSEKKNTIDYSSSGSRHNSVNPYIW